jgi:hypothetical protein
MIGCYGASVAIVVVIEVEVTNTINKLLESIDDVI